MISLKCEDCLGTMEVDEGREILTCPYCGSKKMIPISDAVKIEKIKQEADVEKDKMRHDEQKMQLYFIYAGSAFMGLIALAMIILIFMNR